MPENNCYSPGQTIVLRQLAWGKIWQVRPMIVACDTPEIRAFFRPTGTIGKDAVENLTPAQRLHRTWAFRDIEWKFGGILALSIPGEDYSVFLLRNTDWSIYRWYVNLEEPMYRTRLGYDVEDTILDIFLEPNFSSWFWKDEDELAEVVELGVYSKEKAAALYKRGEEIVKFLQSGKSPFNKWVNWKPDPSWKVPVLPEGWDKL